MSVDIHISKFWYDPSGQQMYNVSRHSDFNDSHPFWFNCFETEEFKIVNKILDCGLVRISFNDESKSLAVQATTIKPVRKAMQALVQTLPVIHEAFVDTREYPQLHFTEEQFYFYVKKGYLPIN